MLTDMTRRRIAVVGGGIAGLSAAWFARELDPAAEITLFEGFRQVGGKLAVGEVGGVAVDLGAEAILNRRPEGVDLARAVGLGVDLVHPATASASVWSRGELVPMPKGHLMGIPGDAASLAGLLSTSGLERASAPGRDFCPRTGDIAVGEYVTERFGREVVDRLVEPLLGGVYAGHADEISLRAAVPALVPAFMSGKPLDAAVRDILSAQAAAPNPSPVFAGIRGGVGRLPIALHEACAAKGVEIRVGTMVTVLKKTPDAWQLVTGPTTASEVHDFDAVIIAIPASPAARLLREAAPAASAELAGIDYASVALVTFAFARTPAADVMPGSGFLIPPADGRFIKASTFSSSKWSWLAESAPGVVIVRASIGRHRDTADLQRDDAELAASALADLRTALGPALPGEPIDWRVQRWGGGLPQYAVGHVERVARIRTAVGAVPGLAVCGAAYDGLGIPACIASARLAAESVTAPAADSVTDSVTDGEIRYGRMGS